MTAKPSGGSGLLSPVSCVLRRAVLRGLQHRSRPILEQTLRDRGPECVGRRQRVTGLASQYLRPVERRHHRSQMQPVVPGVGEGSDRHLTAAPECSHHRAFRRERGARRGVVDGRQRHERLLVIRACFDRDDALTGCRHAGSHVDGCRNAVGEPEPLETGGGIRQALPLLGENPFLLINGDVWCDHLPDAKALAKEDLAHLVLVDNPGHHPDGDFALRDGRVHEGPPPFLTFAGISLIRPALVANHPAGAFALAPLLKNAIDSQRVSGEHTSQHWVDVGTPERLTALDTHLQDRRGAQ